MKKHLSIFCLFLYLSLGVAGRAQAIILTPVVDGTLFDFGDDGTVNFINTNEGVQALNMAGFDSRGIMEFDLSGISNPIPNAFLRLYKNATLGPFPMTIDLYGYAGDGTLSNTDYNDGSFLTSFNYNDENIFDIDLTTHVQGAVSGAYSFLGLNLRMHDQFEGTNAPPYASFGSLEWPPANELHVEGGATPVVPEPASVLLLSSGLLGMLYRKIPTKIPGITGIRGIRGQAHF